MWILCQSLNTVESAECVIKAPIINKPLFVTVCFLYGKQIYWAQSCNIMRKSLIQHCKRSEHPFHLEWTKDHQKCQKMVNFDEFLKTWNSVTRQANLKRTKIGGKFKCDILGHFQTMCQLSCPTFVCMCVVNPSRKWANGNMLVGKLTQQNYCGTSGQIMHLDNLLWVWSMDIFRLLSPWISQFPTQGFQGDFKLMIIGIATLPNSTLLTDRDSLLMAPKWVFLVLREERCRLWK